MSWLVHKFNIAIINISYEEERLHLVDLGKLKLLSASNRCESSIWNTSVKLGPRFRIAPVNLCFILYNCTEKVAMAHEDRDLVQTSIRCGREQGICPRRWPL